MARLNPVSRLLDKARRYGRGVTGIRPKDVFLVSYPKSGNTWVRFFFCNLISHLEWEGQPVDFATVDKTMPELGIDNLALPWPHQRVPRIVKSHNPYWFPFRNHDTILVVRDPRDVAVSHFHYVTGKKSNLYEGDFAGFLRHPKYGMENWFKHFQSWKGHYSVLVRYEDLLTDDLAQFRTIVDHLKLEVDDAVLAKVVESSRFNNVKKLVEERGHAKKDVYKDGFNFMRSGKSKNWVDYFSEEDLALYERLNETYKPGLY